MTEQFLRKKIREMLSEDLGKGDVTSEALVHPGAKARASVIAKEPGILAGVAEAAMAFKEMCVGVKVLKPDGAKIKAGDMIMKLDGPARGILAAERVALNLLMRMSGIATATRKFIDIAIRKNPKVVIAATRKTAPLLVHFDKRAVIVAGGMPHRYNLSDHVLIKDNHLWLVGSVGEAVRRTKSTKQKIEVEVISPEEALEAARAGADILLFDNMAPADIKKAVQELKREGLREKVKLEASGGINLSNVGEYAATGVDVISSSYMTMRAPAIDMSLEVKEKGYKRPVEKKSGR